MNRRTMLAAVGAATSGVAGCLADKVARSAGGDAGADGTVRDHFDTGPDRPECERESETIEVQRGDETRKAETAETIPYPDPPTSFAEDRVLEFVEAFDRAYVTHDVLCDRRGSGHVLSISHAVQARKTFDWYDDVAVVFLRRAAGASAGVGEDGYEWQADLGLSGVVYAVDETGVARAGFDDAHALDRGELESNAPDPLSEGRLVATFE